MLNLCYYIVNKGLKRYKSVLFIAIYPMITSHQLIQGQSKYLTYINNTLVGLFRALTFHTS